MFVLKKEKIDKIGAHLSLEDGHAVTEVFIMFKC